MGFRLSPPARCGAVSPGPNLGSHANPTLYRGSAFSGGVNNWAVFFIIEFFQQIAVFEKDLCKGETLDPLECLYLPILASIFFFPVTTV